MVPYYHPQHDPAPPKQLLAWQSVTEAEGFCRANDTGRPVSLQINIVDIQNCRGMHIQMILESRENGIQYEER
jgi:hypothetical protein